MDTNATGTVLQAQLIGVSALADDALITLDEHGRIQLCNPSAERLFGYRAHELLGKSSSLLFPNGLMLSRRTPPPDSGERVNYAVLGDEHVWAARKDGVTFEAQATLATVELGNQTVLVIRLRPTLLSDQPSREEHWEQLMRHRDIERAHLEAILHQMPAGLFIAEAPSGRLLLANEQAERIWRQPFIPVESVDQYSNYKAFHPDGRPYTPEEWPLARAIHNGETVTDEEMDFIAGDGAHGTLSVSAAPVRDRHGRIVAGVVTFADVTEQNQAERALLSALHHTRELYEVSQYISTVKRPDEVLQVLLQNTYLQACSRASILIFDKPFSGPQDAPEWATVYAAWNADPSVPSRIGQRLSAQTDWLILARVREGPVLVSDVDTDPLLLPSVREYFRTLGTRSFALFPLTAAGDWYGLLAFHFATLGVMKAQHVRHTQGFVDQAAVAIHNMLLLEAEAGARREAERANELRLRFLAMISHELRTPLTSIKGFATTLLAEDVTWDADTQRDFIRIIDSEANKLTEMIEQLLDLSRLESGLLRVNPYPYRLSDIIESTMTQLRDITREHHLRIAVPDKLPLIHADQQRIAQVLINLVSNAAKYSPAQTDITISAQQVDGAVKVNISDHGPGISPTERASVFEAFRRGEGDLVRHTKGAGLGLAICKGIIEAHGGSIWIAEQPESGTTLSFTLPLSQALPQG